MNRHLARTALVGFLFGSIFMPGSVGAFIPSVFHDTVVSVNGDAEIGNGVSGHTSIDDTGRFIAFDSDASNLVPNDTNNATDVFVRDTQMNQTMLVSHDPSGAVGDGVSKRPFVSGNGRFVSYWSNAKSIAGLNDAQNIMHVYVYDLLTQTTQVADSSNAGVPADMPTTAVDEIPVGLSQDGSQLAFVSAASNLVPGITGNDVSRNVYLKNLASGAITAINRMSSGQVVGGYSKTALVTGYAGFVIFDSTASLSSGDLNGVTDVFRKDLTSNAIVRVDVFDNGGEIPVGSVPPHQIMVASYDGRYVAFGSTDNVNTHVPVDQNVASEMVFLRDMNLGVSDPAAFAVLAGPVAVSSGGPDYRLSGNGDVVSRGARGTQGDFYSFARASSSEVIGLGLNQIPLLSEAPALSFDGRRTSYAAINTSLASQVVVADNFLGPTCLRLSYASQTVDLACGLRPQVQNVLTSSLATMTWDPVPGAVAYRLYYVGNPTLFATVTQPSYRFDTEFLDLSNIVITAVNAEGLESSYSHGVNVLADYTPPVITDATLAPNPIVPGQSSTLRLSTTDNNFFGRAASAEFAVDVDPGVGNAIAMTPDGLDWTAQLGANLLPGDHTVYVRGADYVGNWTATRELHLVVFDPTILKGVTGAANKNYLPSMSAGDVLPGLTSVGQTDPIRYGFTVDYRNGALNPNNDFDFDYETGNNCKKPQAQNCHSTQFVATNFSYSTIFGPSNSQVQFSGSGQLTVDGVTTTNSFLVSAADNDLVAGGASDTLVIKIFAPGVMPTTTNPWLYRATGSIPGNKNAVRIR